MTQTSVRLRVAVARRMPDPRFFKSHRIEHHIFYVNVRDLVEWIDDGPNARDQNTNKQVYKKVAASLRNEDTIEGSFHLKNMGIHITADEVRKHSDEVYEVVMPEPEYHGLINGGHTFKLIYEANERGEAPEDQFVRVEVRTRVPHGWIPMIADGLNTAVQVQQFALADLAKSFDWIKDELRGSDYFDRISWTENEPGEIDIRYIIRVMTALHIGYFPNKPGKTSAAHPVEAYESAHRCLARFVDDAKKSKGAEFKRMRPILKECLKLHDIIQSKSHEAYKKATKNGRPGGIKLWSYKDDNARSSFEFPFLGASGQHQLSAAAVFPMLAAFRWYIEQDPRSGDYCWRDGFDAVSDHWLELGPQLIAGSVDRYKELGYNPNALGKSRSHWESLHQNVAFADLVAG